MTSKRGIPMEMHKFPTSSRQLRLEPPHHLKTHSPAMFRCANQNTMVMTLVVCKKQTLRTVFYHKQSSFKTPEIP